MSRPPKVSIGLPVFNGANFIRSAIQSILAQDYRDLELIIADNASTDETESICRELAAGDPRIRYYRNERNLGAAGNYNKVFELARGEYFKWAAHDDECHPAMVRRCVDALENAPASVTLVYPRAELIDEHGKRLEAPLDCIESTDTRPHRRLARVLWSLNMCDPVFGLYRSARLKQTQLIGPFFGADYVLLGELAMLGEIREVKEVLFRLRAHAKRSMKANAGKRARAAWYDPAAARRLFVLPNWERMIWEMFKSALRSPLPITEKLLCCATVPVTHYWRRFRNAGGRLKAKLKAVGEAKARVQPAREVAGPQP
jgi:glycosyltransferase involved in cell wall biosynthesis